MQVEAVNLIEAIDRDRDHDHDVVDDQEVIKKEPVEANEENPKFVEDNLTLAQFSNTPPTLSPTTPSPSSLGKRKIKPKLMQDEISEIMMITKKKKKKKPSSLSKCKHVVDDLAGKHVRCKQEKAAIDGLNNPGPVKSPTMIRAEEVQMSLGTESPSFVKLLVRSHVASCFWMGLPLPFCKTHLPRTDTIFILEDENGEQFELKYIAEKPGLSAGWRKFAIGHKLLEGDVLVFHLVEPNKFKVYIIRANDLTEVDGALSLLNLDALTKQNDAEDNAEGATTSPSKKRRRTKSLLFSIVQRKNKKTSLSGSVPELGHPVEQSGNESEEVDSVVLEGSRTTEPVVRFKDAKSFEKFHILVNGLCIDSELPEEIRIKYYQLCCCRNAFLHDRLMTGLCSKLVAGIIFETVIIGEAIRACKLTTSRDEFAIWEKSLKSFELLGMNVGFLRARLRWLLSLAFDSEGALDTKRYLEAKAEHSRTEHEIENLEAKLVELKEASQKVGADIETLKSKAESYEFKFQEEVNAPW